MTYFIRTKTNRLKMPPFKKVDNVDVTGTTIDWKGNPVAKIGDYVQRGGMGVSAGTIGRLVRTRNYGSSQPGFEKHYGSPTDWWSGDVECLDGKTESGWLWAMTVIPYTAVQEVKDFYIADGRPERIKVDW